MPVLCRSNKTVTDLRPWAAASSARMACSHVAFVAAPLVPANIAGCSCCPCQRAARQKRMIAHSLARKGMNASGRNPLAPFLGMRHTWAGPIATGHVPKHSDAHIISMSLEIATVGKDFSRRG